MALHRFTPDRYHRTFGPHDAVLRVADGDTIETSTVDAAGFDAEDRAVAPSGNPLNGPFFVEGAEPGDRLVVRIEEVRPNRVRGYGRSSLATNVVDPEFVPESGHDPANDGARWRVDVEAGTARLVEPSGALEALTFPLAPMLGCIGAAPAEGQAISSATSGPYGGNMDYRRLGPGTTLILPVFEPGGLLFVGDAHALQGDGEMTGTGVEISADVRLSVSVARGREIGWPRGDDGRFRFTLGNGRPLDGATRSATTEMVRWLMEDHGLDAASAGLLIGACARYEIGNMFDPAYTVACRMPKSLLEKLPRPGERR